MQDTLIIIAVAFTATLLSSMSGGGSSMITTPVWLMLGFPLPTAIASNTVGGTVWTLIAARNYLRGHSLDWRLLSGLSVCGLAGAYVGTRVIIYCDPKSLQMIIGAIILSQVLLAYFRKDFGLDEKPAKLSRIATSLAGFPLGFYEAFFGSGNGIFVSAVLINARGFKLLQALGYYYVMAFAWCIFAATLYISGGNWSLKLMVPGAIASVVGASIGSSIGTRKGAGFVRTAFISVGGVLGLKLLLGL